MRLRACVCDPTHGSPNLMRRKDVAVAKPEFEVESEMAGTVEPKEQISDKDLEEVSGGRDAASGLPSGKRM